MPDKKKLIYLKLIIITITITNHQVKILKMQTIREQIRLQKMLQKKLSIRPRDVRATYCDENGEILFINYGLSFYIGKKKGGAVFLVCNGKQLHTRQYILLQLVC